MIRKLGMSSASFLSRRHVMFQLSCAQSLTLFRFLRRSEAISGRRNAGEQLVLKKDSSSIRTARKSYRKLAVDSVKGARNEYAIATVYAGKSFQTKVERKQKIAS